jgi:flagellar basal body-associated protein FliL
MQIDPSEVQAMATAESAAAQQSNSTIIAVGVGGVMLAIGVGIGFVMGGKRGENRAKKDLLPEVESLKKKIADLAGNMMPKPEEPKAA